MLEPVLYRVRVNSCPDWVAHSSCTLGISVGQPYHEGDKFAATLEWAARHFEHIRVDVSDTLAAASADRGGGPGGGGGQGVAARRRSLDCARNAGSRDCGKPYTIVRWNEWLRHAEFPAVHAAYSRLAHPMRC